MGQVMLQIWGFIYLHFLCAFLLTCTNKVLLKVVKIGQEVATDELHGTFCTIKKQQLEVGRQCVTCSTFLLAE